MKDDIVFKDSLISLELSGSDIETALQTCCTVEDNLIFHNAVVDAVIYGIDESA